MNTEPLYPTNLSDEQRTELASLILPPKPGGHLRRVDMRALCNAIFSIDRTGCQWRNLPREYPNWKTVYWYFTRWHDDGT